MRHAPAHCTRLELLGQRVRVFFDTDLQLHPGQCALARLGGCPDPYLRQPLFPSCLTDSGFAIDLTPADPAIDTLAPGRVIDLLGPVGVALPDLPARSRVLLAAETDPAALLPVAARAIEAGGAVTLLLGSPYPLEALQPEIEIRQGKLPDLLPEYADSADFILVQSSDALRQSLQHQLALARTVVTPSLARALVPCAMPCGVGACGACYVKTVHGWKTACTDGPFFGLSEVASSS